MERTWKGSRSIEVTITDTGQAPLYGQSVWFSKYHPEELQRAVDRYVNKARRVAGVLQGVLEKRDWLVRDKVTCRLVFHSVTAKGAPILWKWLL